MCRLHKMISSLLRSKRTPTLPPPFLINSCTRGQGFPSCLYFELVCKSLQSYHDPESEEEDVLQIPGAAAGDTLTSSPRVSEPLEEDEEDEEEKRTPGEGLEGEKKEDLPDQPPPVEEKPREGRNDHLQVLSQVVETVHTGSS